MVVAGVAFAMVYSVPLNVREAPSLPSLAALSSAFISALAALPALLVVKLPASSTYAWLPPMVILPAESVSKETVPSFVV